MAAPDLLVTKFTIPPVRTNQLPRAPLIERLNQSAAFPLVLISAGAGFGKTTLLATWAGQRSQLVAWLSLDHLDNDPLRFWIALFSAVRSRLPAVGEAALAQVQAYQPPQMIPLLTTLINDLAATGEEIVLVLDDYHVIEEPGIHASLQFLIERAPACLHLFISSRVDPPLALSRLRARGQMAELRDADLRVSAHEAASFLQQVMGVNLSAADERRLAQRTEGWLAGLQLAALSLSQQFSPSEWVKAFGGSQRHILDYLQEEVLARQPPAIRRFLLRVCVLPRMEASLCQAVTGNSASQSMLETLERTHLFVISLDQQRQWYRLHDLFREALLARVQALHPDLLPTLYERASRWYEARGLVPDAVEAALSAGAFSRAAALIEGCLDQRSHRNSYHTLCHWFGQLPAEILQAQPTLSFWYALALMYTTPRQSPASWARIDPPLQWAIQGFAAREQREPLGDALDLSATLAFFQGDLATSLEQMHQASVLLTEHSILSVNQVLFRGLEHLLAGELDGAWQDFLEGQHIANRQDALPALLAAWLFLGEVCQARGEVKRASDYYEQVLRRVETDAATFVQQLMTATGEREPFFLSWAYHNLARLAYAEQDLARAQHYLDQAQELGGTPEQAIHLLTTGGMIRVRVLHLTGETSQAQHVLNSWERQARFPWEHRVLQAEQARLHLALGDLPAVEQWYRHIRTQAEQELPYLYQEAEAVLQVRWLLAQGEPVAALQKLSSWKAQAERQGRAAVLLEMFLLEALAYQADRALPQAKVALLQALRLAYSERNWRAFLDEGQSLAILLKSTLKDVQEPELAAFVRGLLDTFEQEQTSAMAESGAGSTALLEQLTPQEQRILHFIAEGASNQQIANQLVISLVTVKKHVSNILGKLGVANRTQALVRAREYDLL